MSRLYLLLLVVFLAGCATGLQLPPLSSSHPASAEAAEAPVPVLDTLALPRRGEAGGDEEPAQRRSTPMGSDREESGGGHGHHH